MFKVRSDKGFTIIEVMVFLVVSVGVFGAAVATISRQNGRTAFTQAVNDVAVTLQDVFNDVENGYYPSNNDFTCTASASGVTADDGVSREQGKNEGCIFIGKAIQLGRNGNNDRIAVSTIIGKRLDGSEEVTNIQSAKPTLLEGSEAGHVGQPDVHYLSGNVEITDLRVGNSGSDFSGIGIISGFAELSGGTLRSGIVRTVLVPISVGNSVGLGDPSFLAGVEGLGSTTLDQEGGASLCLEEIGGGRKAEIKIAAESQRLSTSVIIEPDTGVCS